MSYQFLHGMFCIFLLKMSARSQNIEIKFLFPFQSEQNTSQGPNVFICLFESGSSFLRKFQKS